MSSRSNSSTPTRKSDLSTVTRLVKEWAEGDARAFDELMALVYEDLRVIAHRHLRDRGRSGELDTTALVHEAYLKLAGSSGGSWKERAQFFAFASKTMRHILIDRARALAAERRGGGRVRVTLNEELAGDWDGPIRLLAIDQALEGLEARDERMVRVVECRFFGGMTVQETALALDTSSRTVERDWTRARAYLKRALG